MDIAYANMLLCRGVILFGLGILFKEGNLCFVSHDDGLEVKSHEVVYEMPY